MHPTAEGPHHDSLLIVEDDALLRELLGDLLRATSLDVVLAAEVRHARAALAEREFSLVICDLRLPDGSGLELLREVAARTPETALLVMTGHPDAESARESFRAGAVDYLLKPFEAEQARVAVREALERRKRARHLRETERLAQELGQHLEALGILWRKEAAGSGLPTASAVASARAPRWQTLEVDLERQVVALPSGDVDLTRTEYAMLACLYRRRGAVVSQRELAQAAKGRRMEEWEAREFCKPHIRNLRRKIEPEPGRPTLLVTAHGRGYRLN